MAYVKKEVSYIKTVGTLADVAVWLSTKATSIGGRSIDVGKYNEVTQKGMFQLYSVLSDAVKYLTSERAARSLTYKCEMYPNIKYGLHSDETAELILSLNKPSDESISSFDMVDAKIEVELRW